MTDRLPVSGAADAGFGRVADAFASLFANAPDMGAALSIYFEGRPVVDLWAGMADARTGKPWNEDTLSVVFSCTKGLVSIVAAQLVQDGRLDYDAAVSTYWPEYAAAGKGATRVRHLLSHQAGLSALRQHVTTEQILDWRTMVRVLETQAPLWPPGAGYAYHAITHGWLAGEVIARITGKSVGQQFSEAIAGPLGADAWIGLARTHNRRVAYLLVSDKLARQIEDSVATQDERLTLSATLGGALPATLAAVDQGFNDPRLWAAQIPGAGAITTARSLARIWSAVVCQTDGVRLLTDAMIVRATAVQSEGVGVFPTPPPWSRWGMGFQLDSEARHYVTPRGFGHDGAGGQVAFAEPELKLGFAFVTNQMEGAGDNRATAIIDALRATLAV